MSRNWINKSFLFSTLCLILILAVGAIFRFYRIRDYLTFLGDEGRDVLVVKRMLLDHQFTLLGPITSVGGMYLGPIYYYFMAPFLWLFGYDPLGPSIMVALFGLATIALVYQTGKEFFDKRVGIIASLLYATSPTIIIYSRSSWNPNILPFFSLLIIYSILKIVVKKNTSWFFIAGFAFGIALQLHYWAVLFFPIFLSAFLLRRKSLNLFRQILLVCTGTIISISPYVLFELRHHFTNTLTVLRFVTKPGRDSTIDWMGLGNHFIINTFQIFKLVIPQDDLLNKIMIIGLLIFFITLIVQNYIHKKGKKTFFPLEWYLPLSILFIWLIVGVIGYSIYRGAVYEYYYVPLFALPFLLIGIFLCYLLNYRKVILTFLVSGCILVILATQIKKSPLWVTPNRLVNQTETIARFVVQQSYGEPYNFALLANGNSDHAYRYFLELWGYSPVTVENNQIDPERKTVTKQLLIVCEEKKCQPQGNSLWEIAGFGSAEVVGVWDVSVVKVIRLVAI